MAACPQCGAELGVDGPAGLCPQCLIQGAFDSSIDANASLAETVNAVTAAAADDEFGRYHIVRTLGEGGMGTVYLAEQREPIRRPVALKVVKLGMDTSQVLARFANERQALAMMDHPHIARIFDAGATPKGRPYFVMEYIDGVPITQYCDAHRLTIGDRLALFLAVCRAVQHAHQKGVIHRDLKPSNVLVMEREGTPVPKVIDFGIAKATDQWAIEKTLLTQFGQMVGTPEYASPEQAEVMTGEVDESSDVYSLGVLLYELLIGVAPFDAARLRRAGLSEMLRIIREEDAPPLARRLTAMGAAAADVATRRQTDATTLRRSVEGDLTWIAMKALDKVRQRRYASVADFAADLQRYVEHRPVSASPPSRVYRARKFLRRQRLAALGTAAGIVFIALGGVTVWSLAHREAPRAKLTDRDTIVLADFDNKTGDPVFDDTLRQGLAVELQQSPFLSLISDQQVQATLRLMGQPKDARLTADIARQICERTGSAAVLEGSIASLGREYVVGLRTRNCSSGNVLDEEQIQVDRREHVLNSLSQIGRTFRTRVGESLATVEKHSVPLEQATTSSLEALKAYSTALKVNLTAGNAAGIPFYRRVVDIDPGFALPYAIMGIGYTQIGEWALARESTIKAWQLRDRVSDREKFFIDFTYDRQVTGNLEKAFQTLELWAQTYPRHADPDPQDLMAGLSVKGTGRWDRVIEQAKKAIAARPDLGIPYENLIDSYFFVDRFDESGKVLQQASARKLQSTAYLPFAYNIALIKGDHEQMNRAVAMAKGTRVAEPWLANCEALALARSGHLQEARRASSRAVERAQSEGAGETAATYQAVRAVWEGLAGNPREVRRIATVALATSNSRDVEYAAGLAYGFIADTSRSEALAADLDKRFPEDTFVRFTYLPVLRALAALHHGRPLESIEQLQIAIPYELAANGLDINLYLGGLHSAYVRGEALMAAHRYADAVAEFQKILDHRGIVGADPIGALAHLQLGRAFTSSGDKPRAKAAYAAFLDLWKDADPDIPILKIAKAEYGRLS